MYFRVYLRVGQFHKTQPSVMLNTVRISCFMNCLDMLKYTLVWREETAVLWQSAFAPSGQPMVLKRGVSYRGLTACHKVHRPSP